MALFKRKMKIPYTYRAVPKEIKDGDTLVLKIDLGFGVWLEDQVIRLFGINTPETRGKKKTDAGLEAKQFVQELIFPDGPDDLTPVPCVIETIKNRKDIERKEKYGRWLGVIWILRKGKKTWINLNEYLVKKGHVKRYGLS